MVNRNTLLLLIVPLVAMVSFFMGINSASLSNPEQARHTNSEHASQKDSCSCPTVGDVEVRPSPTDGKDARPPPTKLSWWTKIGAQQNHNPVFTQVLNFEKRKDSDMVVDVVICHFEEDLGWISDIHRSVRMLNSANVRYIIYHKSPKPLQSFNFPEGALRAFPNVLDVQVIHQANIGREGYTWAAHFLNFYEKLGDISVVIHGTFTDHNERIAVWLDEQLHACTGFLPLSKGGFNFSCRNYTNPICVPTRDWSFESLYEKFAFKRLLPTGYIVWGYGMFAVSSYRVRRWPPEVYRHIMDLFEREQQLSRPLIGYPFERLWQVIMDCADLNTTLPLPTWMTPQDRRGVCHDCRLI